MYSALVIITLCSSLTLVSGAHIAEKAATPTTTCTSNSLTCKYCPQPPNPTRGCEAWIAKLTYHKWDHLPTNQSYATHDPPNEKGMTFSQCFIDDPLKDPNISTKSSPYACYDRGYGTGMSIDKSYALWGRLISFNYALSYKGKPTDGFLVVYAGYHNQGTLDYEQQYDYYSKGNPAQMDFVNWTIVEQQALKSGIKQAARCRGFSFVTYYQNSGDTSAELWLDNIIYTCEYDK